MYFYCCLGIWGRDNWSDPAIQIWFCLCWVIFCSLVSVALFGPWNTDGDCPKKDIYIKQCDTYILLIPNTYMNNINKCNQILKRKCLWRMWYLRNFSIVFYRWIAAFCRTLKPVWHLLLTEKAMGHWSYMLRKLTSTLCSVSNHKGSRNPEGPSSVSDWKVFK